MPDATERKALAICTFVGACLAFAPMEFVSGGALLVLSGVLFALHHWITKREDALLRLLDAWVAEPAAVTVAGAVAGAVAEVVPVAGAVAEAAAVAEASAPEAVVPTETPLGT